MPDCKLYLGDSLEVLKTLDAGSVDACVTDPPYGLSFMGKRWDYNVPSVELWREVLRMLKPGGHLLSFGGTRTYHRMVVNIEDAGFEIRDQLQWLYGSGFPKSLDVSKAIDKEAGAKREVISTVLRSDKRGGNFHGASESRPQIECDITAPTTDAAKKWKGWGTALKPANEPICLARKPLIGTVAQNVQEHGTGALNIDGCRIEAGQDHVDKCQSVVGLGSNRNGSCYGDWSGKRTDASGKGRWPSNVLLDQEAAATLDDQSGATQSSGIINRHVNGAKPWGDAKGEPYESVPGHEDFGGASRFFYVAKASTSERDKGCGELDETITDDGRSKSNDTAYLRDETERRNHHPTVKPVDLMRYLVRMVTPIGATVLDPFMGSGTTGIAADLEGCNFIGIEIDAAYSKIAEARIKKERAQHKLFT